MLMVTRPLGGDSGCSAKTQRIWTIEPTNFRGCLLNIRTSSFRFHHFLPACSEMNLALGCVIYYLENVKPH